MHVCVPGFGEEEEVSDGEGSDEASEPEYEEDDEEGDATSEEAIEMVPARCVSGIILLMPRVSVSNTHTLRLSL